MKSILKETNDYLANLAVMYVKVHNLHWNVVGPQFKAVHEYLESIYDSLAESLDEVAEYIKMDNGVPLAKMSDYLENSTITEIESKDYFTLKASEILLEDIKALNEQATLLRMQAEKSDKFLLVNMLDDHIKNYQKNIWFLNSSLK